MTLVTDPDRLEPALSQGARLILEGPKTVMPRQVADTLAADRPHLAPDEVFNPRVSSPATRLPIRILTVVCGWDDETAALFALNVACAHRLLGADVLLIDCVRRSDRDPQTTTGFNLAQAIANRHMIDRSMLQPGNRETGVPIIDGFMPDLNVVNSEILELLRVLVRLFQVVVINIGSLRESRLLEELLPMSPSVYLLTNQTRDAIRFSNALLLEADPARRWRDRVNLVVERYDERLSPTAVQIGGATGVPSVTLLPPWPQVPMAGEHEAADEALPACIPWVIRAPESGFSVTIMEMVVTSGAPKAERPPDSPQRRLRPNKADLLRYIGASRISYGLAFTYLALAAPSLLGGDLLVLLGTKLDAFRPIDVIWTKAGLDVMFLAVSSTVAFLALRRYFRQDGGIFTQLKAVTEHAASGIAFTDENANLRYANPTFRRLLDLSQLTTEHIRLDTLLASRLGGVDPRELMTTVGEGRTTIHLNQGTDQERHLVLSARRIQLAGSNLGWVVNVQDATLGRAFRETSAISISALEAAPDGMVVVDMARRDAPVVYLNKAFEEITGYRMRDVVGKNCRFLQGADRQQPEILTMSRAIGLNKKASVVLRNYRKDGSMFWNQIQLSPVLDQTGRATHYVAITRDVTALREAAERTEQLAYFDQLTRLPNRTRFLRLLDHMIEAAGLTTVVVARMDVQRLHDVNISAGHALGDAVLLEATARLRAVLPSALLGRITGDEFGIAFCHDGVLPPIASLTAARDALMQRYDLPGVSLHISFALGYTWVRRSAAGAASGPVDAQTAMRRASIATHEAKVKGLGKIRQFDPATEELIRTRMRMAAEMEQSISNDHFEMHYQPKVDLLTGAMCGAEALIRWNHPVFGLQRPDRFIPLAEQTGLIIELGAIAFSKSARMAAVVNQSAKDDILPISVNVSALQFGQVDLLEFFARTLAEAAVPASWLTLELTESVFGENSTEMIEKLHKLRGMGFGLSIDDFGTGYSSLRYLQQFPLTEIKLDRSFVTDVNENAYSRSICEAILTIGKGLGASVVAEGIETPAERQALAQMGCKTGQGFLFSKPVDAKSFFEMKKDHARQPWRDRFTIT